MTEEQQNKAQEIKSLSLALNEAISETHSIRLKVVVHLNEVQFAGDRWTLPMIETRIYKEL